MSKDEIYAVILNALAFTNQSRPDDQQIPVDIDTPLFGDGGHLDSMALVGFLIDVEEALQDAEVFVSLSDDKAMSQARSPFRNGIVLADYIDGLIKASV